jgi:C4-dicarboxylate-specific signal transduction histidine kinase
VRAPVRLLILLDLAAGGAVTGLVLLAAGLPLAARGRLRGEVLAWLVVGAIVAGGAVAGALLSRAVARPVDRLLAAAGRLGGGEGGLPILQPPGDVVGHGLPRAAIAFERLASALAEERGRLAAKVSELQRSNAELAAARESLLRTERLATVGRLAAGVAHEVGNPLGAIGGYAELARARLAGRGGDAELLDWMERIAAETLRIDRIVRELLDFARASSPTLAPVEVGAALEAALRLAQVQPRFRDVEVTLDHPPALPRVLGDEGRLGQVFLNLLLNAGDAMGGSGPLRIAARDAGEEVEVEVADRGPGIGEADLPRIFDPFFTTKPPGEGTGLGLSVCHSIVESFGGRVSAANREGGGAVFTVRLRVARS